MAFDESYYASSICTKSFSFGWFRSGSLCRWSRNRNADCWTPQPTWSILSSTTLDQTQNSWALHNVCITGWRVIKVAKRTKYKGPFSMNLSTASFSPPKRAEHCKMTWPQESSATTKPRPANGLWHRWRGCLLVRQLGDMLMRLGLVEEASRWRFRWRFRWGYRVQGQGCC